MDLIGKLTTPVDPAWLMVRVTALMLPYFEKDTPQAVREMAMEDWDGALGKYPRWAIQNAVRWWQSKDNKRRHKTPISGDIEERADIELRVVRAAEIKMRMTSQALSAPQPRERVDPERANEIIRNAGIELKRMR